MSDNDDTVAVPVELLRELLRNRDDGSQVYADVSDLIPKPKPRLVAVTPANWNGDFHHLDQRWLDAQPDLLTLIDDVLVDTVDSLTARLILRVRLRAALGVTE